jgi:hypothetical protein
MPPVFTFTSEMLSDLYYELNDQDIVNDVLLIDGDPGTEQLIRGVSEDSVKRYGRRSKRIERPLAAVASGGYSGPQSLVEEQLDRYCFEATNPMCRIKVVIPIITDALLAAALALKVSDQITVQVPVMGMDEDFWVDDIRLDLSTGYGEVSLGLVEVV